MPLQFADQATVILVAQLRMMRNMLSRRGKIASIFNGVVTSFWYLLAAFVAYIAYGVFANPPEEFELGYYIRMALLATTIYWQVTPVLTVSFGLALDLKRLLIFPIRPNQFYLLELILCIPTSLEPLIVSVGVFLGLLVNSRCNPALVVLAGAGFLCFNLCLNVAVRALVSRMSSMRLWREGLVFLLVSVALIPQWILLKRETGSWLSYLQAVLAFPLTPWSAAADVATGASLGQSLPLLAAFALGSLVLGRLLFLRFLTAETGSDRGAGRSRLSASPARPFADLRAHAANWLGRFFPEPLASLVEKEFLTFTRSPRFVTVFIMGFTFGIIVFLPIALNPGESPGFMYRNFLAVVSAYAILLMSETVFWNVFGLDRKAVQMFLFAPLPMQTVFLAKNIVGFFMVCLQVFLISLACSAIGVPVTLNGVAEAFVTALVLAVNMFAVGNQSSVRYPGGVNPEQSWSSANKAKFRVVLILFFPIVSLPTSLAYVARFAFGSDAGFYAGMLVAALIAVTFYLVSLDSTIEYARLHREDLVDLLGTTDTAV
ncbi:MAG: hypothetical protein KIT83_07250 [Bryobacterales bacterium]|nr:hypothetical protein [Bryobacterales bacterium]